MLPAAAFAEEFDTENFVGLVLTVEDSSYAVEMYKGITSKKTLLTPVYTEDNAYYYELPSSGPYCYFVTPEGSSHYKVRKNLYFTAEDIAKKTVWDVTPPVRTTSGWDHTEVHSYADVVMENAFPSSPDLWPAYKELLKVPALTIPRTAHQMTTQQEMMEYIGDLDADEDNMYVYTLGKSGGPSSTRFDIPVVFFSKTDLSNADTWQEAAELILGNGKLTVMYQAQLHGNEPAAGEAALAMLKAFNGSYGAGLLDNMNICVLPRMNVYGAYKASRYVYNNIDPNRDFLRLKSAELKLRTELFLALEPEICFDNHEYQVRVTNDPADMHDVKLNAVYSVRSTDAFRELSMDLADEAFARAEENNLGYGWYGDNINGLNASVGTTNAAMRGSLSFLTETNGIMGGNQQLERRMMSHISVVTGILDYVNTNTAAVQEIVDNERKDIIERGKTYEESDVVVLDTNSSKHSELTITGKKVSSGGKITVSAYTTPVAYDTIVKSRPAPTAYVIPVGESWAETVIENLTMNGITSTKIPAGSVVRLQQYYEDGVYTTSENTMSLASLSDEKQVAFPNGAYVMTMDQVNAYILALRMEPDVVDVLTNKGTFVQEGVITATDGQFPIYRYIHDLNEDGSIDYEEAFAAPDSLSVEHVAAIGSTGKITGLDANKTYEYRASAAQEYTPVGAGSTEIDNLPVGKYLVRYAVTDNGLPSVDAEITVAYALENYAVYVDSTNGSDVNDGYTDERAVSTFEQAQDQLDQMMLYAPEGATGEIHLIGTYSMTNTQEEYMSLQAYDYPLLITGGKLIFTDNTNSEKFLRLGGDTIFDNITLQVGSDSNAYYICAEGYKLTIGKNVTTPAYNKTRYFNIMGGVGRYGNTLYAEQTDVTVLSGTWRYVFAGGWVSSVSGEAKLKASNCSVAVIGGAHNGKLDGDLYMELDHITVRDSGALYAGNMQKNNVAGNVTMVLGEGIDAAGVYAGSKDAGNVGGTVTIVADGIDLTKMPIYGRPKNDTGTVGGLKLDLRQGQLADVIDTFALKDGISVKLGCEQTGTAVLPHNINLDLNGNDVVIDLNGNDLSCTGNGDVVVKDSTTDDYDVFDGVYGSATGGNIQAAPGYMVITESGKTSFHKYELEMVALVVNTTKRGITYESNFRGDEKVKEQIKEFGVAMRAYNAPNATTIWADPNGLTHVALSGSQWCTGDNDNVLKSVYVEEIISDTQSVAANQTRCAVPVYGRAYVQLNDGTMLFSQAKSFTMRQAMEHMDDWWNEPGALTDGNKTALQNFFAAYKDLMKDWDLPNINPVA